MEEIVFFALWAFRALQAANKEHGHSHRDQHGENDSIYREPMS
jgi:hypothetical protein